MFLLFVYVRVRGLATNRPLIEEGVGFVTNLSTGSGGRGDEQTRNETTKSKLLIVFDAHRRAGASLHVSQTNKPVNGKLVSQQTNQHNSRELSSLSEVATLL